MFFNRKKSNCSCQGFYEKNKINNEKSNDARIKILGTGCGNCKKLEENAYKALKEMGLNIPIVNIQDISQITSYGIMSAPALILDEKVLSYGKVLNKDDIIKILKKECL